MIQKKWILFLILILSSFLHLWNPVGFPDIFFDEGVYVGRAVHLIETGTPQETYLYDHPYLGQIILGGVFQLTGFPDSLNTTTDPDSLKNLYMIPRIFMGLLAVLDTFLVFKIADKKYGTNVAIMSSVLFAVMPFSWIFKRILLDSLLLPFLLSSLLVVLYAKKSEKKSELFFVSGIMLGLAIFTKVPTLFFIPLIAVLVFQCRKKVSDLAIWFSPVFLIPVIWPLYAITQGDFDLWIKDLLWQAGRETGGLSIAKFFFEADPVLFLLGISGVVFAAYRRDFFILLWFVPMILFLATLGFTQYFHWIPLIPVFCIGSSVLIIKVVEKLKPQNYKKIIPVTTIVIAVFGIASTIPLITSDISYSQFQAMSFVLENVNNNQDITILASPIYTWIFDDVFDREHIMQDYSMVLFDDTPTKKILLIADYHFIIDIPRGQQLQQVYQSTKSIAKFDNNVLHYDTRIYPYGNFKLNLEGINIDIRKSDGR